LPDKASSVIDPETDKADLLFTHEKHTTKNYALIKDIDLRAEARRFGVKGSVVGPIPGEKGLFLPNGVYVTIDRNYDESSIFFLDLKKRTMLGIINPTAPNWDIELCNGKLYLANGVFSETDPPGLSVIDPQLMKMVSTIKLNGPVAGLWCWGDRKLYATLPYEDVVVVINPQTDAVLRKISVGPAPEKLQECRENKICVWNIGVYDVD